MIFRFLSCRDSQKSAIEKFFSISTSFFTLATELDLLGNTLTQFFENLNIETFGQENQLNISSIRSAPGPEIPQNAFTTPFL